MPFVFLPALLLAALLEHQQDVEQDDAIAPFRAHNIRADSAALERLVQDALALQQAHARPANEMVASLRAAGWRLAISLDGQHVDLLAPPSRQKGN